MYKLINMLPKKYTNKYKEKFVILQGLGIIYAAVLSPTLQISDFLAADTCAFFDPLRRAWNFILCVNSLGGFISFENTAPFIKIQI